MKDTCSKLIMVTCVTRYLASTINNSTMARLQPGEERLRRRYGRVEKQMMLYQYFQLKWPPARISVALNIPRRVISRVVKMWKELGDVVREPAQVGRSKIMEDNHIQVNTHISICL